MQNAPTFQEAMAAFDACLTAGAFPMAGPGGETRMLPVVQLCAHLNAELAADGEPPVDIEELPGMFADEVTGGGFYLRPDGRWETTVDYFSAEEPKA
jgi:hypothetical protein